jgi:hypothetical protein
MRIPETPCHVHDLADVCRSAVGPSRDDFSSDVGEPSQLGVLQLREATFGRHHLLPELCVPDLIEE